MRRTIGSVVVALIAIVAITAIAFSVLGDEKPRGSVATAAAPTPDPAEAVPEDQRRVQLDPFTVASQDYSYGELGFSATRDKAQSKLWFHDGSWWAPMIEPYSLEVRIFELREGTWVDTGVFVDARSQSNADVVWTGETLYIASRTSTGQLLLQRYTYGADRVWTPSTPAPQLIAIGGGQSLTIAVDTVDRVWATWVADGRVWINNSAPGGQQFTQPVTLKGGESVADDDATAIVEFAGQIGVLWSNQTADSFHWASRQDTAPVDQWAENEVVDQGINIADGHINFAVSPTGDVYAAVKTSLGDDDEAPESPLLEVLRRDPSGAWTVHTAATVANNMTRPQLAITADGRHLIMVATSPQTGGVLHYKIADTADLRFSPGKGSLLLAWEGVILNDATTTRNTFDPAVPLVVLASDKDNGRYYHAELSLGGILSAP
ncbi:hypothetical protein [Modestobacter sp. URMC 112]